MGIKVQLEEKGRYGQPPPHGKKGRPKCYPFESMKVGETFFVSVMQYGKHRRLIKLTSMWSMCSRKKKEMQKTHPGISFRCAKTEKGGIPGIRVWRMT